MAIVPIPSPSLRMTDTNLRFSDVAQFVGLSLLRDPTRDSSASRSKGKQGKKHWPSLATFGNGSKDDDFVYSQSYSSLPPGDKELSQKRSLRSTESAPLLPQVTKQNSERMDQLKIQIGYLQAERQAEQLQLKMLESSLSTSIAAERKAHERAEKDRERRDFHKERARRQEEAIRSLKEDMRACAEPVQQTVQRRSTPKIEPISTEAPPKQIATQERHAQVMPKVSPKAQLSHSEPMQHKRRHRPEMKPVTEIPKVEVLSPEARELVEPTDEIDDVADPDLGSSSSTAGILISKSRSEPEIRGIDLSAFDNEEDLDNHRRDVIRTEMIKRAGNAIQAFAQINLNGSGRICSQEFADGVARLGVPWKVLTGLKHPRRLFRLFDTNPTNGVISLYELFPTERNKIRDDSGISTPDFWKKYVAKNRNMEKGCGGPVWQPKDPEEELETLFQDRVKNEQSAFKHKWLSTTFRRMKARGKSDARCREMLALHLPKGTGPADRQDVKTFSQNEVKHCKRIYSDAVLEPQRKILKSLYSLREHRRQISTSRQKLYAVALEPYVRQKAQEKVAHELQLGGLSLGLHKKSIDHGDGADEVVEHKEEPLFHPPVDPAAGQASFKQLSKMTGMAVPLLEDVFRIWMKHSDKTETISKKHFQRLVEELCPQRSFAESDFDAWWDQVHEVGHAARLGFDWQASDPADDSEGDGEAGQIHKENDEISRHLKETRKSPATFDQFITWWATSEVRST